VRTFFTYVLAITTLAAVACLPLLLISAVVTSEGAGHGGEWPSLAAWGIALGSILPFAGIICVILAIIAVPAWMVWEHGFADFRARVGRRSSLVGGPLVAGLIAALGLIGRAVFWFGDFRQNPVGDTSFYISVAAVAGMLWGTVFWLRAPKPQTAGIAA